MPALTWDTTGDRLYETGVKKGVLYPLSALGAYPTGVAWNGNPITCEIYSYGS